MTPPPSDRYPDALRVGTALGEFTITDVIGEGGFGTVYLAYEETLDRTVAIKEYLPVTIAARASDQTVLVRSDGNREAYAAGLQSFIREARLQARFSHPAMLEVYRVWEQNGTAYMAMRYYPGESLRDLRRNVASTITIDEAWIKRILLPVFDAVRELHSQSVLHRDVSPDNILILPSGAPVLLDFGAARMVVAGTAQSLTTVLKPGYAPIEQYAGDGAMQQGPWTDVYGLGAVLYFLVIGNPPPQAVTRVMADTLRGFDESVAGRYSDVFATGIKSALAVLPENRLQSVTALIDALGWNEAHVLPYPLTTIIATKPTTSEAKIEVDSRAVSATETFATTGSPLQFNDDRTVISPSAGFATVPFERATTVATALGALGSSTAPAASRANGPASASLHLPSNVSAKTPRWRRSGARVLAALLLLGLTYAVLQRFWLAAPSQSAPLTIPSPASVNPVTPPLNTPTAPEKVNPAPTVEKTSENAKAAPVSPPTFDASKSSPTATSTNARAPTAARSQATKAKPIVGADTPSVRSGCDRIFAKLSLGTAELTEVEQQKLAACK